MLSEWKEVTINDVAEVSRGVTWKSSEEFQESNVSNIRVYKIPHVQATSRFQLETDKIYITKPKNYTKYLLEENDILMVGSNGNPNRVGNVIKYKRTEEALFASFLLRLRAREGVFSDFLYFQILGTVIQTAISGDAAGSTGLRNINATKMKELPFNLPPRKEQQKIAAILMSVDEAIEKTEAIIEQTEKVKKGLMQELLTRGIGHTEFRETEIGQIPDEWKLISLEDLTIESAFGPRFPSDKYDIAGNYALLRTTDINKSGNINYQTMPLTKLPEENFEKHVLKENDLLITRSGTCGIVTIFKGFEVPVIPGAFLIRFRLNEKVNPEFAKLFMMSNVGQSKIQTMASGGVQKNLSGTNLKKLILPLPTTQEQEKIIAVHKSIEEKISKEEKTLVYFQKLKLALMQVLLTGKVRVQVDDPEVIHS